MKLRVECYSGSKADERPVRFRLDDHDYVVEELLDQWYGPDDAYFKVRADDGNFYILRHATATPEGVWSLESYRQNGLGLNGIAEFGTSFIEVRKIQ